MAGLLSDNGVRRSVAGAACGDPTSVRAASWPRSACPASNSVSRPNAAGANSASAPAIRILTFLVVIKRFEAALASQRLPGGSRQPVTLVRSLPAGDLDESRRARWSRSARRPCFVRGFSSVWERLRSARTFGSNVMSKRWSHERPETRSRRIDETAEAFFNRLVLKFSGNPTGCFSACSGNTACSAIHGSIPRVRTAPYSPQTCTKPLTLAAILMIA